MALELRTGDVVATVPVASVRRVETTDSVANGVRKGALAGVLIGGVTSSLYFGALCRNEGCDAGGLGGVIRW
jgi:hypothetical protein